MKKFNKKTLVLLIAATMLLTISVGSTVAYLVTDTGSIVNTFTPGVLDTEIIETFENNTKSEIKIQNIQTVDAYVRVAVAGNWCDDSGNIVEPWSVPNDLRLGDGWEKNGAYYYYKPVLKAGATTATALFTNSISGTDVSRPGLHLVVTVVHQSIQAEPEAARKDAGWPW
ncbi:MAG: hypothetical protein ACI4ME_10355 [Aristaeellaceae bacterium]